MNVFLNIFSLVYQAGDFLFKAVVNYAATPEGQKEWGDVIAAATGVGLVHPDYVSAALSEDEKKASEEKITQDAAEFVERQEQRDTPPAPVSNVRRQPLKHGEE